MIIPSKWPLIYVCLVQVLRQVIRYRKEQVDIDTGARRSWVEEEEREVMDLTGASPLPTKPKLVSPLARLPPTPIKASARQQQSVVQQQLRQLSDQQRLVEVEASANPEPSVQSKVRWFGNQGSLTVHKLIAVLLSV